METIDRQFKPNTHEERSVEQDKNQRQSPIQYVSTWQRKNNRKRTKGRHTQYVTKIIDGTFPPILYTVCIKHNQ